ncbi:MAG: methylmalonyl-CoA mutase family protein [Bacteroidota bacterium]
MIKLFDGFDTVSKDQWLKKATTDLKGENPLEKFQKVFGTKIIQYPYYDSSDNKDWLSANISSLVNNRPYDAWFNTERIVVTNESEANSLAINALQSGSNGIQFICQAGEIDIKKLMANIEPAYCYCSFKGFVNREIYSYLKEYIEKSNATELQISIIGESSAHSMHNLELENSYQSIPKDISISISDTDTSTITTSIARQMSFFVDIVCNSNVDNVQLLLNKIIIENVCLNHYFFEIAKLRALRILFAEIGAYFEVDSPKVFIQSETNGGTDHLENLLINTTQAMSAIVGGTDSMIVTPHIKESKDMEEAQFSARIARNVSNLLNEESHFDKVKDPSAGSYYISQLTEQIVNETWKKFTEIEELGGFTKFNERIA